MRRFPALFVSFAALGLASCAARVDEIGREPAFSAMEQPLGAAIGPSDVASAQNPGVSAFAARPPGLDLFRDSRARNIGDILTVTIAVNDKASFGNSTDRSRDSEVKSSMDGLLAAFGLNLSGNQAFNVTSQSSTKGQGTIDRSETINLSVAAVVTGRLPNGNMIISGTQEIRVNFELRRLTITGIVRPDDISRDNKISYDKIAEARVSYGGRGRLSEVQQPGVVHQIYDLTKPF